MNAAPQNRNRVRIGPPHKLPLPGSNSQLTISRAGDIIAETGSPAAGRVLLQNPERLLHLAHRDARYIAVSPDSRWIATGSHNGEGARIWDKQGKLVQELSPKAPSWGVEFSGDGHWFATEFPACQLWKVGTWEQAQHFPGTQFGFAPDGKTLAVESGRGVLRLFDPANGQELARLENPHQEPAWRVFFSGDGSLLGTLGGRNVPLRPLVEMARPASAGTATCP